MHELGQNAALKDDWAFLLEMGREIIRMAADGEGLDRWLQSHGGSLATPSLATRKVALDLFGDEDHADMLNSAMTFELIRRMPRPA